MIKMPLFGKSQKSPAEVVKALKEAVTSLEKGDKKLEKVRRLDSVCCFSSFNQYQLFFRHKKM